MNKLLMVGECDGGDKYFTNCYEEITRLDYAYPEAQLEQLHIDSSTIIMFGGGSDIPPAYYNQLYNPKAMHPVVPTKRDRLEKALFKIGVEKGAKFIGICRGAQMITALSGGTLWQDVRNHQGTHTLDWDASKIPDKLRLFIPAYTTSAHHQMCRVETIPMTVDLLAWSALSPTYKNEYEEKALVNYKEPEIFYIPQIKALCFQGHPEWDELDGEYAIFSRMLAHHYFGE